MYDGSESTQNVLQEFPDVACALGYGSGFFKQPNNTSKNNMLDFIFILENAQEWHTANIRRNPKDYSFLKWMPWNVFNFVQKSSAGVYYNTLVQKAGRSIKYGVVSTQDLVADLETWSSFYLAGRMQKPFHILNPASRDYFSTVLNPSLQKNLLAALKVALLFSPVAVQEQALWQTVAGLSYAGDFRMTFGENKNKIQNLVPRERIHDFRAHYDQALTDLQQNHLIEIEHSPNNKKELWTIHQKGNNQKLLQGLPSALNDVTSIAGVSASLQALVQRSSRMQSIKGILTAGMTKSVVYSAMKVLKMLKK